MPTLPKTFVTPEQYFQSERTAEYRNEFWKGEVSPMPGVGRRHAALGANWNGLVWPHLRGGDCRCFTSGLRVQLRAGEFYSYPDFIVVSGDAQFTDRHFDTLINPTLLVEILSANTEAYDRGKKAKYYREIPSLQEYLLLSQMEPDAELYRRDTNGTWRFLDARGWDASIQLASIHYTLQLRELYENLPPAE